MNLKRTLFSPWPEEHFSTQQTLTVIGLAGLFSLLLLVVPGLSLLNYPFRLLLTLIHELGHGLAALLTGGEFIRFQISANGSGLAYTAGGWRLIVIPAGYLGVALFGALLITIGHNHRLSRAVMGLIGAGMGWLAIRYAVPTIFSGPLLTGLLTTGAGLTFAGLFLWVAGKASPKMIIFLTHVVAIQAGLTAFSDLFTLIGLAGQFASAPANDARSMAQLTFIPALLWAVLWIVVAFCSIGGAIWFTWLARPGGQAAGS
jgi:hypothetical protein